MASLHCRECSEQLRKQVGLHALGEPYIESDEKGPYLRCPRCGHENRDVSPHSDGRPTHRPDR